MSFSPIIQLPGLSYPPRLYHRSSHALKIGSQTTPSVQSCFPNLGHLLSERVCCEGPLLRRLNGTFPGLLSSSCHGISTRGHCYPPPRWVSYASAVNIMDQDDGLCASPPPKSQPRGVPSSLTTTMSLVLNPFPTSPRPSRLARLGYNVSPAASFHASTSRIGHERYHNALTTTGSSVREKEEKRQSVRSEDRARPEARARTELVTDAAADGISNVVGGRRPLQLQNTPQASHRRQQPSHEGTMTTGPVG